MSVMGSRPDGAGRPGTSTGSGSGDTSAISRNSRSRIFFTTRAGSTAIGLNGPGPVMWLSTCSCAAAVAVAPPTAAVDRRLRPPVVNAIGFAVKIGRVGRVDAGGNLPVSMEPADSTVNASVRVSVCPVRG